jgi:nucleoside phosphorylase
LTWFGNPQLSQTQSKTELRRQAFTTAVLNGPPSTEPGLQELRAAIATGVPAILWDRRPQGDASSHEILRSLASRHSVDLPEQVMRLRRDALNTSDPEHPGRHVALLWDDPDRLVNRPELVFDGPILDETVDPEVGVDDQSIAIMTSQPVETAAVSGILESTQRISFRDDPNGYLLGHLPSSVPGRRHSVVLAASSREDISAPLTSLAKLLRSFPGIRTVILCGIAGGRRGSGVQLGDVVVATNGVVDLPATRTETTLRPLASSSLTLLKADRELQSLELTGRRSWWPTGSSTATHEPPIRPGDGRGEPTIHRGAIGTSSHLIRDANELERVAAEHGILAVDMEAAGLIRSETGRRVRFFVVRGIADFSDTGTKDDSWHHYAASTAAAYVRVLLAHTVPDSAAPSQSRDSNDSTQSELTSRQIAAIADALLNLPELRSATGLQAVISSLPADVAAAIPAQPSTRLQVVTMIVACARIPGGLTELLRVLRFVTTDQVALSRVEQLFPAENR